MIALIIMFVVSLNIDSLIVGISYGIRNIRIPIISKLIICLLSIINASIALILGRWLVLILPNSVTNIIGVVILIIMGTLIIFQNTFLADKSSERRTRNKTNYFYTKLLKQIKKILQNPVHGDIDGSKSIDIKEAFYLGVALSIDAFGASIGSCGIGISNFYLPIAIGICQIIFLTIGNLVGKKLVSFSNKNRKFYFIISGLLLIIIGLIRLI